MKNHTGEMLITESDFYHIKTWESLRDETLYVAGSPSIIITTFRTIIYRQRYLRVMRFYDIPEIFTKYVSYFSFFCLGKFIFSYSEPQYKKAMPTKNIPRPAKKIPTLNKCSMFLPHQLFIEKL
jgi:hypothetical protein